MKATLLTIIIICYQLQKTLWIGVLKRTWMLNMIVLLTIVLFAVSLVNRSALTDNSKARQTNAFLEVSPVPPAGLTNLKTPPAEIKQQGALTREGREEKKSGMAMIEDR